jgi:hypothetical protein
MKHKLKRIGAVQFAVSVVLSTLVAVGTLSIFRGAADREQSIAPAHKLSQRIELALARMRTNRDQGKSAAIEQTVRDLRGLESDLRSHRIGTVTKEVRVVR